MGHLARAYGKLKRSSYAIATGLLLLMVMFETISLLEWAFYPYFPDKALLFARMDATVFDVLSPFSPTLLLLLLYYWLANVGMSENRLSRKISYILKSLARASSTSEFSSKSLKSSRVADHPRILLSIAVTVAVLLGLVPYRLDLNPSMTPVGVDAHYYVEWINQMLQGSPAAAIAYAMGIASHGSRPLLLIPMYVAVSSGAVSTSRAVESLPPILGSLLALSVFYFVREGQENGRMAGTAALLSVFSFGTTVGIWAGFYANWLALSEAYFFLAVFINFSRFPSNSKLGLLAILSVSLLLTHPWTWIVILSVATIFAGLHFRDTRKSTLARPLLLLLMFSAIVALIKNQIFGGLSGQEASLGLSQQGPQSVGLWQNIVNGLFFAYNGLLGNAVLLAISSLAVIRFKTRNDFQRLLAVWVATSSLPFLLLPSLLQTRIMYDLPFPILTTIGLFALLSRTGGRAPPLALGFLLGLLLSANYALRAITSIVAPPF